MVVDHLEAHREVRVIRAFRDADGRRHPVGESWTLRQLDFDLMTMALTFRVEQDGKPASFTIDLRDPDGPQNGRMREWFRVGDRRLPPRPPESGAAAEPIAPDGAHAPHLTPVVGLAGQGRFEEARAALRPLFDLPEFAGESLPNLAEALEGCAAAMLPRDQAAAAWLYEQAIGCWYGWGSMATSGGDGAARLPYIKRALARQRSLLGPS